MGTVDCKRNEYRCDHDYNGYNYVGVTTKPFDRRNRDKYPEFNAYLEIIAERPCIC